ncbi:hypothetical protein AYJ54_00540 [Bradyrhizobium centrolobii]|uniref:Uncharacterized protein n=1 Tax=Bradyrhizobium centrolobii TaxID=1505087 RepID=A0A176YGJ2_9BRAD|nr:hypothetical protein [Bradyrhizobium centrolobii]OAF05427.1 hypothetical protein AYJ54_00540 [Bradyrhizobium centrolobii]
MSDIEPHAQQPTLQQIDAACRMMVGADWDGLDDREKLFARKQASRWFDALQIACRTPAECVTALEIAQTMFEQTHEEPWEQGMTDTQAIYLEESEALLQKFDVRPK